MAYSRIEPFGEYRSELRHGQQMALTANINRDSKHKRTPFVPADFMNFLPEEKPADQDQSPDAIEAKLASIFDR